MKELVVFLSILAIASAISGGHDTNITKHRYQLSLRDKGNHYCGATMISVDWALTSAYCVDNRQSENLSVRAGSANLTGSDGFEVNIDYYIMHPRYNKLTHDSDIALLHFSESLTDDFLRIAYLPDCDTCDVQVGARATMTGWGITEPGSSYPEVLQMVTTSVLSREKCQVAYPSNVISLNMFCAGWYMVGNVTACEGDYGGPVIILSWFEGIISWGNGCGDTRYPTVMTRIGSFVPWIKETTKIPYFNRKVC